MRMRLLPWLALVFLAVPRPALSAEDKPTLIVRVASIERLVNDARHLAELAGREEQAKQAEGFLKSMINEKGLQGIDTKRPTGAYGKLGRTVEDSEVVVLLPIADEKTFLDLLQSFGIKPEKGKDDVYSFTTPKLVALPVYFRFANSYVYATIHNQAAIAKDRLLTPDKVLPAAGVGTMSLSLNLDQVPDGMKDLAIGESARFLAGLKEHGPPRETEDEKAIRVALLDEAAGDVKTLLQEGGELSLFLDLDRKAEELSLSARLTAKSGTKLAENLAELGRVKSLTAAVLGGDSAARFLVHVSLPERLRKALDPVVDDTFKKAVENERDPTKREHARKLLNALAPTLKAGELDQAFDLRGPSKDGLYGMIAALKVKDGLALEKTLKGLVKDLPAEARDRIKIDADKVGTVNVHRLEVADQLDKEAKQLFGANPVYLAFRDDAVFVTAGDQGQSLLKEALAREPRVAKLVDVEMSMARLVPLMAQDNPAAPKAAKEAFGTDKGGDRIRLTLEGGDALKLRLGVKAPLVKFFAQIEEAKKKGR
jgi:hypothetical protein